MALPPMRTTPELILQLNRQMLVARELEREKTLLLGKLGVMSDPELLKLDSKRLGVQMELENLARVLADRFPLGTAPA